jgi:signal peptidase
MHNIKTVKSDELFPVIQELLQNNQKVRMTVTGNSMMPFLREDTDSVELSSVNFNDLRFGQIPLIKRNNGQYILHRLVYKKKNCFYISGDAELWIEGPIMPDQLIAVVTNIWHNDKQVSLTSISWKLATTIWWLRLPVRYIFVCLKRFIKRLMKKR